MNTLRNLRPHSALINMLSIDIETESVNITFVQNIVPECEPFAFKRNIYQDKLYFTKMYI